MRVLSLSGVSMKVFAFGGFAALAGVLLFVFVEQKPADVYDMPVKDAYLKLSRVDFGELTRGQKAAGIEYSVSGNGKNTVYWTTQGSHVRQKCDLMLAPLPDDAGKTHVTVHCAGGSASAGAAAGMLHNSMRNTVIERVDATLTGRPFDKSRAGETASRWPGDGVDGSYGTAVNTALKMDAEVRKMQRDSQEYAAERAEQAKWDAFNEGGEDYASDSGF